MLYAVVLAVVFAQDPGTEKPAPDPSETPAAGATGTEQKPPAQTDMWQLLLPFIGIAIVGYLFMIRPAQRQEAERKKLLTSLKKGDDVLTTQGIYGQVVSVSETEDEVVVKVDEGTRLKMLKSCIMRNMTNEKAAKEQQAKK